MTFSANDLSFVANMMSQGATYDEALSLLRDQQDEIMHEMGSFQEEE